MLFVWDVPTAIVEDMAPDKTVNDPHDVALIDVNVVEILARLGKETWIRSATPNDLVSTNLVVQLSLSVRDEIIAAICSKSEFDRTFE